jgi:hypothetical protein
MGLADKYRAGSKTNLPVSNYNIDSLATLESINRRQGWLIAGQIATIATIAHQTTQTVDAIHLVNNTLRSIEGRIQDGFENLEDSINRLESNLLENLKRDFDPNTETMSKFKIAKYSVQAGDNKRAHVVMGELIIKQHFDTVSLAVSHSDYAHIDSDILSLLQSKL